MKKSELKQIIKECINEIGLDQRAEGKKQLVFKGSKIIQKIKELGKKEFGI
jgi:ribosomal protein S20